MTDPQTDQHPADNATAAPKKVYFVSLGCAKNQVDTEVMLGVVENGGHEIVDGPNGSFRYSASSRSAIKPREIFSS